jgi:hypothetical protein
LITEDIDQLWLSICGGYQYQKKLVAGSDWLCNSIKTENACVLSGYISCPVIFFGDEFWRIGETKQKGNILSLIALLQKIRHF